MNTFDIVLVDDQTMDIPRNILSLIVGEQTSTFETQFDIDIYTYFTFSESELNHQMKKKRIEIVYYIEKIR